MSRERIFSTRGFLPKKGLHPVIGILLFAYAIFILIMLFSSDMKSIRFTGPGIIPILLMSRAQNNKERPISLFLDHVERDELCIGYYEDKEDSKEYFVEEYSYWYSSNKKDATKVDLFFRIKTVRKENLFLSEENTTLGNPAKWELSDEGSGDSAILIKVQDLEGLAVQMDRNSTGS